MWGVGVILHRHLIVFVGKDIMQNALHGETVCRGIEGKVLRGGGKVSCRSVKKGKGEYLRETSAV